MAGPPPVWPLFSSLLSPTGGGARYGVPTPTAGIPTPYRPDGARALGKSPVDGSNSRRGRRAPAGPPSRRSTQATEVRSRSHLSRTPYERVAARQRRGAALIWASLLVFVFVAGIASRIWLR